MSEAANRKDGNPDGSVDASNAPPTPTHIYVNYLYADHKQPIHAYRFPLRNQEVPDAVKAALAEILKNPENHRVPGSPKRIFWNKPSYIVFILNDTKSKLKSVEFILDGTTNENHTFYDGTILDNLDSPHSGIYYLNARQNFEEKPLSDGEGELYRWKSVHLLKANSSSNPITHENSGTNIGP